MSARYSHQRRAISSTPWNAIPDATPSSSQSTAANRDARRGASTATSATGTSLSASSVIAAIATLGPVLRTHVSAPTVARKVETTPMTVDQATHPEKKRMYPAQVRVLVRARKNHATATHRAPR